MKKLIVMCGLLAACSTQQNKALTKKVSLNPSFYSVAEEKKPEDGERKVVIWNREGKPIYETNDKFYKELRLEGTGKTLDGRYLNYCCEVYGSSRFSFVEYPQGSELRRLVPFRSVAIDKSVYKMGQRFYIEKLKGVRLPDGSTHDGYVRADDIGSAIKGNRIDLFTGTTPYSFLEKQGIIHGKELVAEMLDIEK